MPRINGHLFKSYNKWDVEVELAIKERLQRYPVPDFVWDEYHLDQEINDRGIGVDMQLVKNVVAIDTQTKQALLTRMQKKTELKNPNSVVQMKGWLAEKGMLYVLWCIPLWQMGRPWHPVAKPSAKPHEGLGRSQEPCLRWKLRGFGAAL